MRFFTIGNEEGDVLVCTTSQYAENTFVSQASMDGEHVVAWGDTPEIAEQRLVEKVQKKL